MPSTEPGLQADSFFLLAETACGRFRGQPSGRLGTLSKGVAFASEYVSSRGRFRSQPARATRPGQKARLLPASTSVQGRFRSQWLFRHAGKGVGFAASTSVRGPFSGQPGIFRAVAGGCYLTTLSCGRGRGAAPSSVGVGRGGSGPRSWSENTMPSPVSRA